jgi:hypothetical protein
MTGRIRVAALAALAAATFSIAAPAEANRSGTSPSGPTLTLVRDCELGFNAVDVILGGFPPLTTFEATLQFDGGGVGPLQLTTDANGFFNSHDIGHVGSFDPVTFTATIVWEGGTLTESLFVDCTQPGSKDDCKDGGWKDFSQFKNQGQCIAFVNRGEKP